MNPACEIDWTAVATFAAVAAAIGTPYLAAHIDGRRRRRAALQLAEMAYDGLTMLPPIRNSPEEFGFVAGNYRNTLELDLNIVLETMAKTPPDYLHTGKALNAFLRLQALAERGRMLVYDPPDRTDGSRVEDDLKAYLVMAKERIEELRQELR